MAVENTNVRMEQILSLSRAIYIINPSGILLHHENFLQEETDPDLYAGLFSALTIYAKGLDAGSITNVGVGGHKFVFKDHIESGNLIVIEVEQNVSTEDGAWLLEQIVDRFAFMERLQSEGSAGSFSLETLFSERGRAIDWSVIQNIRVDALEDQKRTLDKVETLNMAKISVNNRLWVKLRKICTSLVENQKGLTGLVLYINHRDHLNKLYSGRGGKDQLSKLMNFIEQKFYDQVIGLELETEYIQIDDLYVAIFNVFVASGGMIAIASVDSYLVRDRLTQIMERVVSTIERLAPEYRI